MPKAWVLPDGRVGFNCPGCSSVHAVPVNGTFSPSWGFNGNLDSPTFTPSIKAEWTSFSEQGKADYEDWYAAGMPDRKGVEFDRCPHICHSFVTNGVIEFCPDSTHSLSGQKIPMPECD